MSPIPKKQQLAHARNKLRPVKATTTGLKNCAHLNISKLQPVLDIFNESHYLGGKKAYNKLGDADFLMQTMLFFYRL